MKQALLAVILSLVSLSSQAADRIRVKVINEHVIVFVNMDRTCANSGYAVLASSDDGKKMRGCGLIDVPVAGVLHIDWKGGDFSEFPWDEFADPKELIGE